MTQAEALVRAREILVQAQHVVVFTGAGVSAESGLSTFRDVNTGALWVKFDPDKIATMNGFEEDPRVVWDWYAEYYTKIKEAQPNPAHLASGALEKRTKVTVVTQNVDDLHERGGSTNVLHLHGDLARVKCARECGWESLEHFSMDDAPSDTAIPSCPRCEGPARPDVVWFGEFLPPDVVEAAERALDECDACVVIGTSAQVYPAAGMPLITARNGKPIISINTRPEDHLMCATVTLNGRAGELFPLIV